MLAHVGGMPVEETLLAFGPVAVTGVGLLVAYASQRAQRWRRPRAGRRRSTPR